MKGITARLREDIRALDNFPYDPMDGGPYRDDIDRLLQDDLRDAIAEIQRLKRALRTKTPQREGGGQ